MRAAPISRWAPTQGEIAALQKRLPSFRDAIRNSARPLIVEFAGLPRSGKSTCITIAKHFLRRNGMAVFSPAEGASIAPEFLKDQLLHYNVWAACYALMTILEGLHIRQPEKYDVVFLDRGLFDAICWVRFLQASQRPPLSKAEMRSVTRFLRVAQWKTSVDLVCLFTSGVDESFKREHAGMLIRRGGMATNKDSLRRLLKNYRSCERCYSRDFSNFMWLHSTAKSNPTAAAYAILEKIFDIVEEQRK